MHEPLNADSLSQDRERFAGGAVRRATLADEAAAQAILHEYYDALAIEVRDTPEGLRSYLRAPGGLWLARDGDAVVGCIALRPLATAVAEIKRLYVRPAHRGRRLADALLDALEADARSQGVRELYLDTHAGLAAATHFYQRRGYIHCERYNDNPQATIFMQRRL